MSPDMERDMLQSLFGLTQEEQCYLNCNLNREEQVPADGSKLRKRDQKALRHRKWSDQSGVS